MAVQLAQIKNDTIVNIIVASDDWQKFMPNDGYTLLSGVTGLPKIGAVKQNDGSYWMAGTKPTTTSGAVGGGLPGCGCTQTGMTYTNVGCFVYTYSCLPTNGGNCACNCPNSAEICLGIFGY